LYFAENWGIGFIFAPLKAAKDTNSFWSVGKMERITNFKWRNS
jgi:hypothetical protein